MADKYDLPPYVMSRVRYYDGEYLKDDEFIDEQKYHIDRRQRHDRLLHVAGVCEGLVPALVDGKTIKVGPGTAIDDQGRTILVESDQTIAVKPESNGALFIQIMFGEKEERPADGNSAVASNTRFSQAPALKLTAAPEARAVVLGQASILNGTLSQVTMNGRVYSGLRIPGPGNAGYVFHARGDAAAGLVDLECSLNVTGTVQVSGNRIKNKSGLGIVETDKDDWLRVNPDSSYPGVLLLKAVAIPSGGLSIGETSQQPAGALKVTGKATVTGGVVASGVNIGTNGAQTTYTYPYESLGTDNPGHNLRLLSKGQVLAHTVQSFVFSKLEGGSGDAVVEGALSFGSMVRQMINLWNDDYGIGVQSGTLYFRTAKNFVFYKGGAHNDSELNGGGGSAALAINNGNVGIGTTTPGSKLEVSGNASFSGDATVKGGTLTIGEWRLEAVGENFYIKRGTNTIARFSVTRDRFHVYKNINGSNPYFYYNSEGNYSTYSG